MTPAHRCAARPGPSEVPQAALDPGETGKGVCPGLREAEGCAGHHHV